MAHTVENANLVWQKANNTLAALDANPNVKEAFLKLNAYLSQAKGNPDLKFTAISATVNGSNGGDADTVAADAAATLVAIFVKKSTGTTAAYNAIANHASAIQAAKELILGATAAGAYEYAVYPNGRSYATGITYASVTAYNGTTRSLKVDSSDGFIITRNT